MSPEPLRVVDGGRAPRGWEALWLRDVWFESELPHGDLASRYRRCGLSRSASRG